MASTIALTAAASVSSTPIANTLGATFASNYTKLSTFTPKERKVIRIVALTYQLANVVSLHYEANHSGLISDASIYTHGISNPDMETALAVNDWASGNVSDSTNVSTDPVAILLKGKDFHALTDGQLDRILAFLRSALAQ